MWWREAIFHINSGNLSYKVNSKLLFFTLLAYKICKCINYLKSLSIWSNDPSLLVISNYLLIDEGNLGCYQPNSPAAGAQQDWIILVPSPFTDWIDWLNWLSLHHGDTALLVVLTAQDRKLSVWPTKDNIPQHLPVFTELLLECLYEYWGKFKIPEFSKNQKSRIDHMELEGLPGIQEKKEAMCGRYSPQCSSVYLCSCGRSHYKACLLPKVGRVKIYEPSSIDLHKPQERRTKEEKGGQ